MLQSWIGISYENLSVILNWHNFRTSQHTFNLKKNNYGINH